MAKVITLDTIAQLGTAEYPWQNTYLIMELLHKVESLENRVIQLELARLEAMGDEDIDCSDIPETTEEEFVGALRGVFYGDE